ncbi:lipid-transfer protein [Pseudomaricurvus alkylphenolicus]|uniref:thiolase C-terminal domain-containing protein n=1 Tax=Pseudomaricurvus alkylphenolicus TaxID=1306991 RepID=UPI00141D854E|nr:lipid-transfer protein [Pseudomaricurvus alkylphenolicus]NIB38927.1 lipid-transfer protein [Pseudomaricurvus alkylphenolicus]
MFKEQNTIKDKAAIVGIGETQFAKQLPASETELACKAISAALKDAGVSPSEVDGLASYTMESTSDFELAKNLGFGDITFFGQIGHGGGGGPATLGMLAMAIATGQCQVGVAWRSRKRGNPESRVWANKAASAELVTAANWSRPWGVLRPVDEVSLITQRYMHETGCTRQHLANVAVSIRKMANNNPRAMMYDKPLTTEDYMAARWISEPLCLYDNCLESDGALAVVLVSAERARDCNSPPVYLHAFGQGISQQSHSMVNFYSENPLQGPSWTCARQLFRYSDIQAQDIDVAQFYDAFTPLIPFSLEAYGFCGHGEGAAFTEDGGLDINGKLPCNTSGGGLSEAYVHGFNLITEGVRQLRGQSCNQVREAETCLVTASTSVPTSAVILRR